MQREELGCKPRLDPALMSFCINTLSTQLFVCITFFQHQVVNSALQDNPDPVLSSQVPVCFSAAATTHPKPESTYTRAVLLVCGLIMEIWCADVNVSALQH